MRKTKKVWALALAFVMVCTLLPFMGKEVKAADDGSVTWTASANSSTFVGVADPASVTIGDMTVDPLYNYKAATGVEYGWKLSGDYMTGGTPLDGSSTSTGDNPRNTAGTAISFDGTAPVTGVAVKITVTKKGTVTGVVLGGAGAAKYIYVTEFAAGETENGNLTWCQDADNSAKVDVTIPSFTVEPGKDYYVYVQGSKLSYKSFTFTPSAEAESPVSTLGVAYREEGDTYGNGVRFGSELDKTAANYNEIRESGTLVALQSVVGESATLTTDTANCSKVKRTTVLSEDESTLQYSLVVTNIPENAKSSVLVARPYVELNDGTILYGEQISGSWDSVQEKVSQLGE